MLPLINKKKLMKRTLLDPTKRLFSYRNNYSNLIITYKICQ